MYTVVLDISHGPLFAFFSPLSTAILSLGAVSRLQFWVWAQFFNGVTQSIFHIFFRKDSKPSGGGLVPRPPTFFVLRFSFSIIHGSGKRGRPGNTYHVNDVWWDVRGRCPSTNACEINDRASFLPVKSSTVDLVNLRSPGYR